jgi:acylphosphatase
VSPGSGNGKGARARRAIVRGRVQGVGFRFFAERAARDLGIRGWVRNLPDGSVETLAVAEEDALERYFARLRKGPLGSRVEGLEISEADAESGAFSSFEITR